jgi:hypothetical protein
MQCAARGLVAVAGAGGAMLLTMVFSVGGFKEWVDGWAEEWVDGGMGGWVGLRGGFININDM